jgi:S-adenosylmethionine:tRNA ribosyltransferase-isomerase
MVAGTGRTSLFIRPPYTFRVVDVMLTNFHLPESTLLMMVSAFAGWRPGEKVEEQVEKGMSLIRRAYEEAIREKYRFYSYGDCMLMV